MAETQVSGTHPTYKAFAKEMLSDMAIVVTEDTDSLGLAELVSELEEAFEVLPGTTEGNVVDFDSEDPGLLRLLGSNRTERMELLERAIDEGYSVRTTIFGGTPVMIVPVGESGGPDAPDREPREPVAPLMSGGAEADPVSAVESSVKV